MTASDWEPIFQAVISGFGLVITTLIAIYVPRLVAAFEKRTGVVVTAQEREAVQASIATAAGILKTRLDQGTMRVGEISTINSAVQQIAKDALARVPDAAAAQGTSLASAIEMVVGAVDTARQAPAVVVAPVGSGANSTPAKP